MKLLRKHIEKDGSGSVGLRLEHDEDLWHAYNLIQEGDEVRSTAIRRIVSESSTGSTDSKRIRLMLTIRVKKVVFSAVGDEEEADPSTSAPAIAASSNAPAPGGSTLHISGPVTSESQHVKMGAFHTLDLEAGRDFTVIKAEGGWDSIGIERVREATQEAGGAEVGAIICGDGVANVCLLTQHTTIVRQRIDVPIPRKRKGGGTALGADKALARFYSQIYQALLKHFDLDLLKVVIIASPGFVNQAVYEHIFAEATRTGLKTLLSAKSRFLLIHSPSHHVHSLTQVLAAPEVATQLKDTKFAREGMLLQKFFKTMNDDELRAWYGEEHVFLAAERGAIGTLLISDRLFRSNDFSRRHKFVQLVESVKKYGAQTVIFSSMHESGEQLNQLTGIAALLTYPLDIEDVQAEEAELARAKTTSTTGEAGANDVAI